MVQSYWGLEQSPFQASGVRARLAASPVHAEALARLDFLRDSQSPLGLLLGPAGCGKSTVLAEFAERAKRAGAIVATVSANRADVSSILAELSDGLCLAPEATEWIVWRRIADRLSELALDSLRAVVLFDDLDRAAPTGLAIVERLLSLHDAPLTIVAAARPQTLTRLGAAILAQAALRIDLTPWSEAETCEYLLSTTQSSRKIRVFDDSAARRLFELSGGAPRRVNLLAQLALVAGASQNLDQIDAATIDAVHEELSLAR